MITDPYRLEKRSITLEHRDTTLVLERIYWVSIERIAKRARRPWRWLVKDILNNKPKWYRSRAGWLRAYVAGYAYAYVTKPSHQQGGPRTAMEWDVDNLYYRFPRKPRWVWDE